MKEPQTTTDHDTKIAHRTRSLGLALSALLAGILLGCCFPPVDAAALAWFALVPLGFVLSSKRLSSEAWAGVYLGGLAYHLIALQWIGDLETSSSLLGIWLVLSQVGAMVFCASMLISWQIIHKLRIPACLGLPFFWLGFELLRYVIATAIDPALAPWLRLGGTQLDWSLIAQSAALGGELSLSLLVALFNGWLFHVVQWAFSLRSASPVLLGKTALLAPIALILSVSYGWWCLASYAPEPGPTVALLGQQDWLIDHGRRWTRDSETEETGEAPDLLIWPELSDHHKLVTGHVQEGQDLPQDVQVLADVVSTDYATWFQQRLSHAAKETGSAILLGCERVDLSGAAPQRYNSVVFADRRVGFLGYCDKIHLVPMFEREALVANWLGIPSSDCFLPGSVTPRFTLESDAGDKNFACIVCYDIAFADRVRAVDNSGIADFFVHCGSEATDKSGVVSETLLRMARLRAIESRRPIVRNCHQGACGVIDHLGRFTPSTTFDGITKPMTIPLNPDSSALSAVQTAGFVSGAGLCALASCFPFIWLPSRTKRMKEPTVRPPNDKKNSRRRSSGFSLLELLAVVAILGSIAAVVLPRVTTTGGLAEEKADLQNRAIINAAVERFYLMEGDWPEDDLSDIGAHPDYFPQGIPVNPVTEAAYELDPVTHRVKVGGGGK